MKCPVTGVRLNLEDDSRGQRSIVSETVCYPIDSDIALFLDTSATTQLQKESLDSYSRIINYYDQAIDWLFASTKTNEPNLRRKMIDELRLELNSKVVDVGAGTGRDSIEIIRRLGAEGRLYVHDISTEMLRTAKLRLGEIDISARCRIIQGSAENLPFEDGSLDALYSFGGLNEFGNFSQVLKEFARVVRIGGRIVVGDEGVAPWLTGSEHHRILAANNPIFFSNPLPINHLPENANEVSLQWVLGNAFYLLSFTVGSSTPELDLDLEHKGRRGGSLRTRYFGALDGVDPTLRQEIVEAASRESLSVRNWLERTLRKQLND